MTARGQITIGVVREWDIKTVRELLGHKNVEATMACTGVSATAAEASGAHWMGDLAAYRGLPRDNVRPGTASEVTIRACRDTADPRVAPGFLSG